MNTMLKNFPKTFNSLYGIPGNLNADLYTITYDFQFPLWDTIIKQKYGLETNNKYFQFPLWDTEN